MSVRGFAGNAAEILAGMGGKADCKVAGKQTGMGIRTDVEKIDIVIDMAKEPVGLAELAGLVGQAIPVLTKIEMKIQ